MSQMQKILKLNRWDFPYLVGCTLTGWVLGVTIVLVIMAISWEPGDGYAAFGVIFALIGAFVGILTPGGQFGATSFSLAVSMGQTRRSFLLWDIVLRLAECLGAAALLAVLWAVEERIYVLLYPGEHNAFGPSSSLLVTPAVLLVLLGTAGALLVCHLILTALMVALGRKGYVAFFTPFWLSSLVISPSLNAVEQGESSLLAWIGRGILALVGFLVTPAGLALLVLAAAAITAVCLRYLLRAPVRL